MATRKRTLLKVIILGESGYVHINSHERVFFQHLITQCPRLPLLAESEKPR